VRFVIITGLSGSGKSIAMKYMEDMGYFCVDNLPPALIPKFAELCHQSKGKIDRVALAIDIRVGGFFDDIYPSLDALKDMGIEYEILFLESSDDELIKRYKESRRQHPLEPEGRIANSIQLERSKLEGLKNIASIIIDTSNLLPKQLKEKIISIYTQEKKGEGLLIYIVSFGFKYGIPLDSDLVFDVRFLPNPFYIKELKEFSGDNQEVRDYVMGWPQTNTFLEKLKEMVDFLIPYYHKEGKSQLVVSIGCTGGKHRSVVLANTLYQFLKQSDHRVIIDHRDIGRDDLKGEKKVEK
jgi:RNase adapter protein RapZ